MEYKRLRASQVRLDPQNPRLPDGTSSDHEAINRLLEENYPALLALAKDLVETGESNPSELPIVIKDGTKYLVLEGNRRFAALKLLGSPALADDEKQRAAFARLAKKGTQPAAVMCAVDTTREAVDHWLVLRHTGENRGVGVRRWNTQQVATHRKRANATVDSGTVRSIVLADELEEAYAQDPELVSTLRRIRASKLTNIGRFFSVDVLSRLHLSIRETGEMYTRERTLWAKHSTNDLHALFVWAVQYIDGHSVDFYKNAKIRSALLDKNRELLPDTTGIDALEEARLADSPWLRSEDAPDEGFDDADGDNSDDSTSDDQTDGDDGGSDDEDHDHIDADETDKTDETDDTDADDSNDPRKNEAKPEKRLFQDLRMGHLSRRTQFLLKEARQVVHEDSPGIACVMARVVVELVVSEPEVLAWSGARERDAFKDKVIACIRVLDPKYDRPRPDVPALRPAYLETANEAFGITQMHQFVHNPTAQPDLHMSRRFSANFRPLLKAINTHTGRLIT